jgi:hypothetical protein
VSIRSDEAVVEGEQARDRDTIERWEEAGSVDLASEIERGRSSRKWVLEASRRPAAGASDEPYLLSPAWHQCLCGGFDS